MAVHIMAPALKLQIDEHHVREGAMFGSLPGSALGTDDHRQLDEAGWTTRDYRDGTFLVPPSTTVRWDQQYFRFRDAILHQAAHTLPSGLPVAGNGQAILEEVIASAWEARLDQLRTVWSAFAFAALRVGESNPPVDDATPALFAMEDQETYFFYTAAMAEAARRTLDEVVKPPPASDDLWRMLNAIHQDS